MSYNVCGLNSVAGCRTAIDLNHCYVKVFLYTNNLKLNNMKLISMTDFVLEQSKRIMNVEITHLESHEQIVNYANFLKQPLKLKMFVSKNEENILFNGFEFTDSQKYSVNNNIKLSVSPYGLNNEKLLLTKLNEQNKFHTWFQLFTIEDLIQCDLELTPNAIKRIF